MKKNTLLICLLITNLFLNAQNNNPNFKTPNSVTEEIKINPTVSRIFIPVEIQDNTFKTLLENATPQNQQSKITTDSRDLNVNFSITDSDTKFVKTTINHQLILGQENSYYRTRNWTDKSWPFKGRTYGEWDKVNCKEVNGTGKTTIDLVLSTNYEFKATVALKTEIEKLMCLSDDLSGIAKIFNWQDYKTKIKTNLEKELKKIDFKTPLTEIWNNIQTPLKASKDLYLLKKPEKITYKDFYFEKNLGKVNLGLNYYVSTCTADDSALLSSTISLPDLTKSTDRPIDNFDINLPLNITYIELQKIAKSKFSGQGIKAKNSAGKEKKYAKVLEVEVFGSKEEEYNIVFGLVSKIFKKSLLKEKSAIYIHTKLAYDTIQKKIFISDFKIDAKSKEALANADVNQINNENAFTKIISRFQLKIKDVLEKQKIITKKLKEGKINISTGITLNNVATALSLSQVIAQPDRVFCLFNLNGTASTEIMKVTTKQETK